MIVHTSKTCTGGAGPEQSWSCFIKLLNLIVLKLKIACLTIMICQPGFPTMCDQQRLRSTCACAQSDQSLC